MADFLELLRANVEKSPEELESLISDNTNLQVSREELEIGGSLCVLHRLFVSSAGEYSDVGWVLNSSSAKCMICSKEFWLFLSRHHCRGCGNLVCDDCSPDKVIIKELASVDPQRVCVLCYWGQV